MAQAEAWQVRFWRHVAKSEGCWLWTGMLDSYGYGRFWKVHSLASFAHRAAWELAHGEPPSLFVLHRCDVRHCVNPSHLFLGTKTDNARDRDLKARTAKGESFTPSKLTEQQVLEIRQRYAPYLGPGLRFPYGERAKLMRDYSICSSTLAAIVARLTWKHI